MKISKKGLLAVATLPVLAAGIVIGAANANGFRFAQADAKELVNFSTKTITRRFYFVNNDNWWTSDTLEVHVWGGSLAADQWATATKMYDSYNYGLYYADIEAAGIGAAVNAQIHQYGKDGAYSYTTGRLLPSLADKTNDVMWLNNGYDGNNNRNMTLGTAGGTSGQVASFLDFISTCTTSYASGYNAYPQLKANFLDPSAGQIEDYGDGTYVEGKTDYNLNQKIAKLEALYTAEGWYTE